MNAAKNKNFEAGVINQLHSMLTNHPERMHSMLKIVLKSAGDGSVIGEDEFEIYTDHPEDKITEKVEKLRTKGGITTLRLKELTKVSDNKYTLMLEV